MADEYCEPNRFHLIRGFPLILTLESVLADGSMLCPEAASNVRCRWWYRRVQSRGFYGRGDWIVRASLAPTQNAVRQTSAEDCK